jgi:hypothetical protein
MSVPITTTHSRLPQCAVCSTPSTGTQSSIRILGLEEYFCDTAEILKFFGANECEIQADVSFRLFRALEHDLLAEDGGHFAVIAAAFGAGVQELEPLIRMAPEQMADFPSGQDSVYILKHMLKMDMKREYMQVTH